MTMNSRSAARQANAQANTSGTEPALKYVQANGVRFAYLEQGDGPLVMFLHGFPDNAWSYRKQLQVFADAGYRAVAPFLRGYAPTEIPADGIFDPIALGKDLEGLIAALSDDGQARVVGMDWGGTSTFQALATAPSAIKAAVVMNTAHPITISSIRRGSGARSSRLPCLFLPAARRRIRGQYRGTSLRRLSLEAVVADIQQCRAHPFNQGDAQLARHDGRGA